MSQKKQWWLIMLESSHFLSLPSVPQTCWKRGGNPRRHCLDGQVQWCQLTNNLLRTAFSTWSTSQNVNGTSSTTMSRARSTPWWKRPLHLTWQNSLWQGRPNRVREKDERDTGVILTRSKGRQRERAMDINVQSFSRQLNAGSAVSMATSPLSVAADGTDGNSGIHMDLIQAAREGRPNGRAGIGGRATLAKVGELTTGEDQPHQVLRLLLQSLCAHHQQQRRCLIQPPLLTPLPRKPVDLREVRSRLRWGLRSSLRSTARSMISRTTSACLLTVLLSMNHGRCFTLQWHDFTPAGRFGRLDEIDPWSLSSIDVHSTQDWNFNLKTFPNCFKRVWHQHPIHVACVYNSRVH